MKDGPDIHDREGIDPRTKLRIKNDLAPTQVYLKYIRDPDMSDYIFDYIFKMSNCCKKKRYTRTIFKLWFRIYN